MSTSHARIALYGSGPALNAAEEVLRMAGRNPMFVANSEELSTADVVLYEGEAPSSLLPEIPVFQVGEGIDLEYGLDPVNDPAGTLACMDAVVDEQLASLDAEHDLAAAKEELFRVVKAQAKLEAELESLAGGIEDACEETGGRLRKLVIEAEFRGLISQELCAEDALRTSMQYLIHKIGVSNAVVATPGLDGCSLALMSMSTRLGTPPKMWWTVCSNVQTILPPPMSFAPTARNCKPSLIWIILVSMAALVCGPVHMTKQRPRPV